MRAENPPLTDEKILNEKLECKMFVFLENSRLLNWDEKDIGEPMTLNFQF